MRLMDCQDCGNWKCEDLTYNELLVRWEESIGGEITPGFMQRYERAAERQGVALRREDRLQVLFGGNADEILRKEGRKRLESRKDVEGL